MARISLVRRSFLQALGLGGAAFALGIEHAEAGPPKAKPNGKVDPDASTLAAVWVHHPFIAIAANGAVTIASHRAEMGQGVRSTLPVLMADELGADMKQVSLRQADGDEAYGDQSTDGSTSVRSHYEDLRKIAATARMMLIAGVAKKWKVEPSTCVATHHAINHPPSKRSMSFGEASLLAATMPVPDVKTVELRPESELTSLFRDLPHLDAFDMSTGRAQYGADIRLPGMLVAVIARPPVVFGKVKSFDPAPALAIKGVRKVVEMPAPKPPCHFQPLGGVAVIAENTWSAMRGRRALEIKWDDGDNRTYDSIAYRETLLASVRAKGEVVRKLGDVDAALAAAKKKVEAEYVLPHLAHAPMEPPACLAHFKGDSCEVWAPTQEPQDARDEVAKALGLDKKKVTVHMTFLGGAFGRKAKPDFIVEAALLSKMAGAPVRVQWTREDDIRHGYYHSTCAHRFSAGMDATGKVTAWLHRCAFPSISSTFANGVTHAGAGELQQGTTDFPLAVPNFRMENGEAKAHVRIGWLRSVHNINYAFAAGSFIDELAVARAADPRDMLLEIVGPARVLSAADLGVAKASNYGAPLDKHPIDTARLRRVIERVTELADWTSARKSGRFLGLAAHRSFLSYVAVVMSVVMDGGKPRVDEAWIVADAGKVLNHDRARAQMEGAIIFGIGLAMHGAITMKNGAVEQGNFRDYRIARIGEVPSKLHIELVKSDRPPGGIGEPGLPPVAPALANAVFAATGKRIRELPLMKSL